MLNLFLKPKSGISRKGLPFNMFRSRLRKKYADGRSPEERAFYFEQHLDRVRASTSKRNSVKAYLANIHGVAMRRIVLMDNIAKFVGRDFTGRYVIKNRTGLNTKVNF